MRIREAKFEIDGYIQSAYYVDDNYASCVKVEALQIASEAVEKQIGEKPVVHQRNDKMKMFCCPECMEQLSAFQRYCDNCGQFLDWGDYEC